MVGRLLESAPAARVIATSRSRLGNRAERVLVLAPLPLADARRVFLDRVAAVAPNRDLTQVDAGDLARMLRALDGLPLAIELAASRARTLEVPALLEHLGARFRLLRTSAPDVPERHASLEAAIGWSWDLAGEPARRALLAASLYRGGFDPGDVAAVVRPDDALGGLLDLDELVDASLVHRMDGAPARFGLLEGVRAFGRQRLGESPEGPALRARHAGRLLERLEPAAAAVNGPDGRAACLTLLEAVDDALDAAEGVRQQAPELAARLVLALAWPAVAHGHPGVAVFHEAMGAARAARRRDLEVRLAAWTGMLRMTQRSQIADAKAVLSRGIELADSADDLVGGAMCRMRLAVVTMESGGDLAQCCALLERAIADATQGGDDTLTTQAHGFLCTATRYTGKTDDAARLTLDNLERVVRRGDAIGESMALAGLALAAVGRRDAAAAEGHFRRALAAAERTASAFLVANHRNNLAWLCHVLGRLDAAEELLDRVVAPTRLTGVDHFLIPCLGNLTFLEHELGRLEEALATSLEVDALMESRAATGGQAIVRARRVGLLAALDRVEEAAHLAAQVRACGVAVGLA